MIKIDKKLIKHNFSKRTDKIKYIVIHNTDNYNKGAGALNHFNFFNSGDRRSSADYFVDDKTILQVVEDYNYSWHCGDGKGEYGITNNNSIGIEICVNSDGDYNKAINNAVGLVKHLINKYKIPLQNVVRHYDASRKTCPKEIIKGKNNITWDVFKTMIKEENKVKKEGYYRVVVGSFKDKNNAIKEQEKLKSKGFNSFLDYFEK